MSTRYAGYLKPSVAVFGATLGLVATSIGIDAQTATANPTSTPSSIAVAATTEATGDQGFTEGIYLYGESDQPNQVGSAYFVFQVIDDQVVGAAYQPYSSFDCFHGTQADGRLELTGVNSYDQSTYAYALPITAETYVADAANPAFAAIGLEGLHPIPTVSELDTSILETCKADLL